MLTILSGGTGTPKLLQGITHLLKRERLSVIVNTAEDVEVSGLHVSPDLDTVMYTLAGIVNDEAWYGVRRDTFACHDLLERFGEPELLRIGDRDRAVKLYRTLQLRRGKPLSEVTEELCAKLGVRARVLPMSDDQVQTRVRTEAGTMSFHEYWVRRRAADKVKGVSFEGAENAKPAPGVLNAIHNARAIVIGPSNPVTSIGPILAIEEIKIALLRNRERVIVVSPMVGKAAVSGPAGELLRGLSYKVSPFGVARFYREFASALLIDRSDRELAEKIEEFGIRAVPADLFMPDLPSRVKLARKVLELAGIR